MVDLIVLHGEFSLFTVRGNFWYQIYRNRRKKVLCSRLSLITLTIRLTVTSPVDNDIEPIPYGYKCMIMLFAVAF